MEFALLFAALVGPYVVFLIGIPQVSKLPKRSVMRFLLSACMLIGVKLFRNKVMRVVLQVL